jgi:hypothetical protein
VKKKFLIGVAPLVVAAAFAPVPAAEGAPHVYKNGVIAKEGTPLRTVEWGNFKFKTTEGNPNAKASSLGSQKTR